MSKIISDNAIQNRNFWIEEIRKLSGHFGNDTEKLEKELEAEIKKNGIISLIDHLRLCGNIPESYGHDTSEEKLYSKYTDCLLSLAYTALGLKSLVLKERADAADVEAVAKDYSFVADAKAFRLSRTQPKIKKILKYKQCTLGNEANLMRWLFVQFINFQALQAKFTSKPQRRMFVFLHIHIWRCYFLILKLKGK